MYLAYLRVSEANQNLTRQEAAVQEWGKKMRFLKRILKSLKKKYPEKIFRIVCSFSIYFLF